MMANDTDNYLTANFVSCCVRGLRKHYEESACNDYHFHVIQSDYVHHLGVSAGARPGDYRGCGRRGSNNRFVLVLLLASLVAFLLPESKEIEHLVHKRRRALLRFLRARHTVAGTITPAVLVASTRPLAVSALRVMFCHVVLLLNMANAPAWLAMRRLAPFC